MRTLGRKTGHAGLLCGIILFEVVAGVGLAHSAEPGGSPAGEQAKEVGKDSGPFGGCEPIGLTASGELVFPLECKKMIKKPAESPVAEDKPPADETTASTDAKPPAQGQAVGADKAAAAAKPPAADTATAPPVAAAPKHAAVTGKPSAGTASTTKLMSKPVSSKSASGKTVAANPAATSAAPGRTLASAGPGKPSGSRTMVVVAKDAGQADPKAVTKEASRPSPMAAIRSMIVMAKPSGAATAVPARSQIEERPRLLRTASMPACVQFRSYNPATRSYRGYDGHIYACR
ncbi:hypothetical protein ACQR1I_11250 [Bradyrhizobium sp. HKCCYLS2038]|uniref:hypothetical protein n=1 Tax=unclassified Bradyrhizobium TaxID=2631580 RepID=UPI003EBEEBF1